MITSFFYFLLLTIGIPAIESLFVASSTSSKIRSLSSRSIKMCTSTIPPLDQQPPLKILLLVEPTPFGYVSGYANRFKEMLKFLHKAGDKFHVLTPDPNPDPPKEFLGFPITTNRGFEFPLYNQVTLSFDFKRETQRILREFQPDIIHVSTPSALVWPAVLWAILYKTPLVMSYHTDFQQYARAYAPYPGSVALANFLLKSFHAHADLVLCTSPQLRDSMEKIGIQRVDVWQKGINAERFSPSFRDDAMRQILSGGHPEAPLLVYVGRLGKEKRLDRLKAVLDAIPGARLALVGKGPAEDELRRLFKDYPVYFSGQLIGDDLSKAFASSDIFVMPSDSETLGFVVLEAMASGIPVVGVAAGGLIDIIDTGSTGYLVSNTDGMQEFIARTRELVENAELCKDMGASARKWAEGWSWESASSKLRNIQYRQAIANFHERRGKKLSQEAELSEEEFESSLASIGNLYRPDLA